MSPRLGGILFQNLSNFCNISLPNVNYLLAKIITKNYILSLNLVIILNILILC